MKAMLTVLGVTAMAGSTLGFDPQNGDWLKDVDSDLRVMTWNVEDALCSTNFKGQGINNWNAVTRIIAAMEPDILIMQETGDNSGNGTGGGVDAQSTLTTVMNLMIQGGTDGFTGGVAVESYIQLYEPHLDYFVFVSSDTDGFNRNVILSRFPFADLNQDNGAQDRYSNIVVLQDLYAPGFNGGIRGYQFAEIDLPDDVYAGDVVIGNGHLKAGGGSSNESQRITAAQNIAYFIDHFYNGAGTGTPDPRNRIPFDVAGTVVLDENTPVIWGGDINQNPSSGTQGPAEWMTNATPGSGDGTDRDGSNSNRDFAANPLNGQTSTLGSSKLDYLFYQDSIAGVRRQFIFNTNGQPFNSPAFPPEVVGFAPFPTGMSTVAADHLPVIVDFILPEADDPAPTCVGDVTGNGNTDLLDLLLLLAEFGQVNPNLDFDQSGLVDLPDLLTILSDFGCEPVAP